MSCKQHVYIMGRGHSGSTILDIMLGNSKYVESIGELVSGMSRWDVEQCSCGEKVTQCEYWHAITDKSNYSQFDWSTACDLVTNQAHIKNLPKAFISSSKEEKEIASINRQIFNSISKKAQKQIVLESSKEITRALSLLKNNKSKIIHLVRNPIGIANSDYKRIKKGNRFRFLRKNYTVKSFPIIPIVFNSFFWLIGNLISEIIKYRYSQRVLTIRYEDLCSDPADTINEIETFIDVPLDDVKDKVKNRKDLEVGHNVAGNGMRFNNEIVFDPSKGSKSQLPKFLKMGVKLTSFPLMKFYSYI